MTEPEEDFARAIDGLVEEPGTEEGTGFASMPGIKVNGKIAAMLVEGRLVVKLPEERCRELVESGVAEPFRMGKRTMREWICVWQGKADWGGLAHESHRYVRSLT